MSFSKDFAWGVATAAYQIEGGAFEADKGLNGWDVGCATEGRVFEGHTGNVACDHYHRFREDVALMKELGVKNYRLSINWSRLMPHGKGEVSAAGKEFYLELFRALKEAGITPWVTVFHWDYPYDLYLQGGWLNPDSPKWFEEYASVVATLFGDYVSHFIIINEPQCFVEIGHKQGGHAPFLQLPRTEVLRVAHNVLLGCGLAEKKIRAICKHPVKIGFAQAFGPAIPASEEDTEAARKDTFACHDNLFSPNFWTDPVIFGKYPEEFSEWFEQYGFHPSEEDMKVIRCQVDFYAVNTYQGYYVKEQDGRAVTLTPPPSMPKTDMRWNVTPEALYYGTKFVYERYRIPVIYTENGVALTEWKTEEGTINDDCRIDFIRKYLRELHRAAQEVEVAGYFYWSFLDNFEWAEGYSKHFGLVHVDYDTMERTPKKSAYWYAQVMKSNGEELLR